MGRSLSNFQLSDVPSNATLNLVKDRLATYKQRDANDDTASFLDVTYQFLPIDGKTNLADDIGGCGSDAELQQLAEHIDSSLVRPFLAAGGQSKPVTPSLRVGTEDSIEILLGEIVDPVKREQQRLREQCLLRDGYRCVITKAYDTRSGPPPRRSSVGNLVAAHIVPIRLGSFETDTGRRELGSVWQCFYRYFPGIKSRLNFSRESINDWRNVMMLDSSVHIDSGNFSLALQPTSVENQYRIWNFLRGDPCTHTPCRRMASSPLRPMMADIHFQAQYFSRRPT